MAAFISEQGGRGSMGTQLLRQPQKSSAFLMGQRGADFKALQQHPLWKTHQFRAALGPGPVLRGTG